MEQAWGVGERDQSSVLDLFAMSARHSSRGAKSQLDVQVWRLGEGTGQEI